MTYISAGYGRVDQMEADCARRLCAGSYLPGGTMQERGGASVEPRAGWNGVGDDDGSACGCPPMDLSGSSARDD